MTKTRYSRWVAPWMRHPVSGKAVLASNALVGIFFAASFVVGSWRDGTLYVPGRTVGLLEHPAIWIFIVAQILVPVVVSRSIVTFSALDKRAALPLSAHFLETHFVRTRKRFYDMLRRRDKRARRGYDVLLLVGLVFWTWNTFQNLRVGQVVVFDFWDSSAHFWGYWLTRIYKLHIWLVVAPGLIHAQLSITRGLRRLLRTASREGGLILDPYHPDGAGGTRAFIDAALLPMFALVLPAVILTTAATWVHGTFDITTIGAITATVALFMLVYFYPAAALRSAILNEKDRQKRKIAGLQRSLYDDLLQGSPVAAMLRDPTSVLLSLSSVAKQIDALPNWPQLARVVQVAALFVGSPFVAQLGKFLTSRLDTIII